MTIANECLVRPLKNSDLQDLRRLWSSMPGIGLRRLDDAEEGLSRFIRRNPNTSFVALIDDELIGSMLCGHDGRRGYLYHAAVKSDYQGLKIGRSLFRHVKKSLCEQNIHKVALVAYVDNEMGNAFWRSIGFTLRDDLNYWDLSLNSNNE